MEDCRATTSPGVWKDIWCDHYSYGAGGVCEFEDAPASGGDTSG